MEYRILEKLGWYKIQIKKRWGWKDYANEDGKPWTYKTKEAAEREIEKHKYFEELELEKKSTKWRIVI